MMILSKFDLFWGLSKFTKEEEEKEKREEKKVVGQEKGEREEGGQEEGVEVQRDSSPILGMILEHYLIVFLAKNKKYITTKERRWERRRDNRREIVNFCISICSLRELTLSLSLTHTHTRSDC